MTQQKKRTMTQQKKKTYRELQDELLRLTREISKVKADIEDTKKNAAKEIRKSLGAYRGKCVHVAGAISDAYVRVDSVRICKIHNGWGVEFGGLTKIYYREFHGVDPTWPVYVRDVVVVQVTDPDRPERCRAITEITEDEFRAMDACDTVRENAEKNIPGESR